MPIPRPVPKEAILERFLHLSAPRKEKIRRSLLMYVQRPIYVQKVIIKK